MANSRPSFKLSIISAEGRIYDQEVAAISSTNEAGDFDVLPFHANFISIIKKKVLVHELNGQIKEFPVDNAVLKAVNNQVNVYIGIENIDLNQQEQPQAEQPPVAPS